MAEDTSHKLNKNNSSDSIMLVLIAGRCKEEVVRNTAAPLDQVSRYCAEIWES